MPEGHTIHKAARHQRAFLVGTTVRATSPQGRFVEGARALDRARLVEIEAVGKHLFYRFERRGRTRRLHVHLGLAGRFRYAAAPPAVVGAIRLRLVTATKTVDLRGPLICELVDDDVYAATVAKLGPDPIAARTTSARFRTRLRRTRVPIGAMLLDQSVIAGVGNVYRAELLFLAGIDPRRPSSEVTDAEIATLWRLARTLLRAGVTDGRIVTTKYGPIAAPKWRRTYAYKQRICLRCNGAIATVKLAGRPCFYCPTCQPSSTEISPDRRVSPR